MRLARAASVALWLVILAFGASGEGYAYLEQSTLASHADGSENRWPCMARLSDGRILVLWSRVQPGSREDGIVGSVSTDCGCTWCPPKTLIAHPGIIDADPSVVVSGSRVFVTCTSASFAQGIRASTTWCVRSEDDGATWSEPYEIPMGHTYTCGKTHHGLRLKSGTLLMGYSWDVLCEQGQALQTEGEMDLRAGVLRSTDNGDTWINGGDTHAEYDKMAEGAVRGTDEPGLVALDDGSLYLLMRTGADHLYEARSTDEGATWHDIQPSPLYGSNAPAAVNAFVTAGRQGIFAVWDNALDRFPLCAAASFDGGRTWSAPRDIGFPYTGGQASYPSCEQATDGTLLAVWQQDVPGGRDVRLARFSAAWLLAGPVPETPPETSGGRPLKIVAFGDSTTAVRGPLRVYAQLLTEDLPAQGVAADVVNAGVGGNTTAAARERFAKDVLERKPDVAILGFGINDAAVDVWKGQTAPRVSLDQYEANLRYFIAELRGQGAQVILMTPNPLAWTAPLKRMYAQPPYNPGDPDGFNVLLKDYAAAVRKVAESEHVTLVDVYALFSDYAKTQPMGDILLDGMHPSDLGQRLVANALLDALADLFPSK